MSRSNKPYADALIWCDLETTGGDEMVDSIIEIGAIATTAQAPFEELGGYQQVIVPVLADPYDAGWVTGLDPVVFDMHTANGLIADIHRIQATPASSHPTIASAGREFFTWIDSFGPRLLLAGSGVGHFDRRFIRRHMPEVNDRLLYPVLDVGVIRRSLDIAGLKHLQPPSGDSSKKNHRGLDDVTMHLDEFRHYMQLFATIDPGS